MAYAEVAGLDAITGRYALLLPTVAYAGRERFHPTIRAAVAAATRWPCACQPAGWTATVTSIIGESSLGADTPPLRVALADDSFLIREAVQQVLAGSPAVEVVASCRDGATLLEAVDRERPDVVITDLRMPPSGDDEGLRIARALRATHPEIGVVVLRQYADPRYGLELLGHGADGRVYLLKDRVHSRSELLAAIEVAASGGAMIDPTMVRLLLESGRLHRDSPLAALTPREREVLAGMATGKSNGAIAEDLVLTKRAVEKHVGAIFFKLGLPDEDVVSRRVSAVLLYLADEPAQPAH